MEWATALYALCMLLALFLAVVVAAVFLFQDRMVYVPDIGVQFEPHPREYGLEEHWREFTFSARDGTQLYPDSKAVPTLLWFHSNAGIINHRLPNIVGLFKTLRVNVCIPEYRGYGRSAGAVSEAALRTDAEDVLAHLRSSAGGGFGALVDPARVVVFGRSLGGAVAAHVASARPDAVGALVLENTFTSLPDLIPSVVPALAAIAHWSRNKWATRSVIGSVRCPLLLLSSGLDEMIPPSHMEELYQLAKVEDKTLKKFERATHMDMYEQRGYYEYLAAWIARVLGSW
eukprot:m51a1_g11147 hypothetical protein (287) ;mRNA; f:239208-240442